MNKKETFKLNQEVIEKKLLKLNNSNKNNEWLIKEGKLFKEFTFSSFEKAFEFMNAIIPVINKLNHHPDWSNNYKKVCISLITHSCQGLSNLDFSFAEEVEKIIKNF